VVSIWLRSQDQVVCSCLWCARTGVCCERERDQSWCVASDVKGGLFYRQQAARDGEKKSSRRLDRLSTACPANLAPVWLAGAPLARHSSVDPFFARPFARPFRSSCFFPPSRASLLCGRDRLPPVGMGRALEWLPLLLAGAPSNPFVCW
jgi:hypothetical protein